MRLDEVLDNEDLTEARMVWARSGNKIVRKVRCTSGRLKGKTVSSAAKCSKPVNIKRRMNMKKLKARFGKKMARKARRTKRFNPLSKRLKTLNKR